MSYGCADRIARDEEDVHTAIGPEGSARVLELAFVHPRLGRVGEGLVPGEVGGAVLRPDRVVCGEVRVDVRLGRGVDAAGEEGEEDVVGPAEL